MYLRLNKLSSSDTNMYWRLDFFKFLDYCLRPPKTHLLRLTLNYR